MLWPGAHPRSYLEAAARAEGLRWEAGRSRGLSEADLVLLGQRSAGAPAREKPMTQAANKAKLKRLFWQQ